MILMMNSKHIQLYQEIKHCLQNNDNFLLTTHVRPDGDSLTSVLVFASILRYYNKKYRIILDDCIPKKLHYLHGVEQVEQFIEGQTEFSHQIVLILDSSDIERVGRIHQYLSKDDFIINIDHHPGNSNYGQINLVDPTKSSTVELVYPLVDLAQIPWSSELATLIYTGILSDTGRFLFANTSAEALFICAEMVSKGADPSVISEMLYNRVNPETMRAYANALSTLEFHFNDQVTCIYLSNEILCQSSFIDTEGFVDTIAGIEGVKASFFMMEKAPGEFRVSFRSKGEVDTNKVAGVFGGGGHIRASGCNIKGSLNEVRQKILDVLAEWIIPNHQSS